ncbi:hypothetical protein HPP92_016250 [Vanilla planifolia]|nr:hypothetical protein HPP92_016250 [Vanilla planifolia]
MSAFQDFGPLSERRRAEKQQNQRKRLMVAGASVSVVLILAVVGVATSLYHSNKPTLAAAGEDGHKPASNELHTSVKYIKTMCSATDFKEACESSLSKVVTGNKSSDPKEIVRAAVSVIASAAKKGFQHADGFVKSDNPRVKSAISLCKSLFDEANEELQLALSRIDVHKFEDLPNHKDYIKNWLSAAMHYQVMCIDAFPEGEEKTKMKEAMKHGKQLTSNALAIIGAASRFLSLIGHQRNLAEEKEKPTVSFPRDGLPTWVTAETRRHLKEQAKKKLTPNVTVAKDGSGDFRTINGALNAMPKKYTGR